MGRWIKWRVSRDLEEGEIDEIVAFVEAGLRSALPVIAARIRDGRPRPTSFWELITRWGLDRENARYARRDDVVSTTRAMLTVAGVSDDREFGFAPVAGEYHGHTIGLQDYASIGVLAAASQISGSVELVGGDDLDADYVALVLERLRDAGVRLSPKEWFAARLPVS